MPERVERLIKWHFPEPGWIKLNTDGAVKGKSGIALAGGVLRDHYGTWLRGFCCHMMNGTCSPIVAELWGICNGLQLAWDMGIRRLILEADSVVALQMILREQTYCDLSQSILNLIKDLLSREWEVRMQHTYREGNRVADWLANFAVNLPIGMNVLIQAPCGVRHILNEDFMGVCQPRMCALSFTGFAHQFHISGRLVT